MASRSAARSAMIMKFEPRFVPAQLGKPPRLRERDIGVAAIWAAERDIGHIRFARDVALADLALRSDRGDPPIVKRRDADIACFGHRKAVEADRARGCCHPVCALCLHLSIIAPEPRLMRVGDIYVAAIR